MIVVQTPLRISFLGGGTDFEDFYAKEGGAVLSTGINLSVYIIVKERYDDFIYINLYLLVHSAANSAIGFVFWIIATKLYTSDQVGIGSALTSAMTLLAFVGTLGLGMGIIRFLPELSNKKGLLNTSFTVSFLVSLVAAAIFVGGAPYWSPKLLFLRTEMPKLVGFAGLVVASSFGTLAISIFIGFRKAEYAIFYTLVNAMRLPLLFVFSGTNGSYAILLSWGLSEAVAVCFAFLFLFPRLLKGYAPIPHLDRRLLGTTVKFTSANFVGEVLRGTPSWVLPLIVVNVVGASENAYFYIAWTIAGAVLLVPVMTSLTFLAEGSQSGARLGVHIKNSLKLNLAILIPVVMVLCAFGGKILLIMGKEYSSAGAKLLWLLAPAAIPAALNMTYVGMARVEKRLGAIIAVMGAIAVITLGLSWLLIPRMGLMGVGVGWLAGQTSVAAVTGVGLARRLKSDVRLSATEGTIKVEEKAKEPERERPG